MKKLMKNYISQKTVYLLYNTHSYDFSKKVNKVYKKKIDLTSNFEEVEEVTIKLYLRIDSEAIIGKIGV